jgi:phosphoadenosine phosphosulfate reductase
MWEIRHFEFRRYDFGMIDAVIQDNPYADDDRRQLVADADRLAAMSAEQVVRWAGETFGGRLALTASFGGGSGMVLVDLVVKHAPYTPIILVDTGVLFPQTYQSVHDVEKHYGITVQRVTPKLTIPQQAEQHGEALWSREPDKCCDIRKVQPLAAALNGYRAWMTAIRRDQSETRADTASVSWNKKHNLVKIAPLATWKEEEVWAYIHSNGVPFNPMLADGYSSIGCTHCTSKPTTGDGRSGRWVNFAKKECGLHL